MNPLFNSILKFIIKTNVAAAALSPSPSIVLGASSGLNDIKNATRISHFNYQNNEDLNWFYQPATGVATYLVHFDISQMESCCDYLSFGPYGTNDVPTKCTGISGTCPDTYITSSTGITFNFHSDNSKTYQGFSLSVIIDGTVTVIAGNGDRFNSGDNGQASSAGLYNPSGITVGTLGDLYIADTHNNRIRMVAKSTGIITTVAGNGVGGYSGDNGPASSAGLYYPSSVAVNSLENLYIADTDNNRIRMVTKSTGTITTIAGNGNSSYSGDNGPASSAGLDYPQGIAIGASGIVYIADTYNNRIRMVKNGIITTIAGNGNYGYSGDNGPASSARISYPYGVAVDVSENVYFSDTSNHRIRMVTKSTGIITTFAGNGNYGYSGDNGPASSAGLYYPQGIAIGASGIVYIADAYNYRIRKVIQSGIITTIASGNSIVSTALDGFNNLYFTEVTKSTLSRFSPSAIMAPTAAPTPVPPTQAPTLAISFGSITTIAGNGTRGYSGDNGPATAARIAFPWGIAIGASGNVYFADTLNSRIRMVAKSTSIITTVAGNGVYGYSGDNGPATAAGISTPWGIAADTSENIYFADFRNHRIRMVTQSTGIITTIAGSGSGGYSGDDGPASSAALFYPRGIAVDVFKNFYIADDYNNRIRMVTYSTGIITTIAGNGNFSYSGDNGLATGAQISNPAGITVSASGNIYFVDSANNRIRMVTKSTGIITTVAGNGIRGYSGDNGPALTAGLYFPRGIAVDASDNIYFADSGNDRIRMVTKSTGIIISIASAGFPYGVALDGNNNIYFADANNNKVKFITPPAPTAVPTPSPTAVPTIMPILTPTATPTPAPTAISTIMPTPLPTAIPTPVPISAPTFVPSIAPTLAHVTMIPTLAPVTMVPSIFTPITSPTATPIAINPTTIPSPIPTFPPSPTPTLAPVMMTPSNVAPSTAPTAATVTINPTAFPATVPTVSPSTTAPSPFPSSSTISPVTPTPGTVTPTPPPIASTISAIQAVQVISGLTVSEAGTPKFATALHSTISLSLGLPDSGVIVSNMIVTQNRRLLLASVSIAYTILISSTVNIDTLKYVLDVAVSSGSFASSLSINDGVPGFIVQGTFSIPTTSPTFSPSTVAATADANSKGDSNGASIGAIAGGSAAAVIIAILIFIYLIIRSRNSKRSNANVETVVEVDEIQIGVQGHFVDPIPTASICSPPSYSVEMDDELQKRSIP